MAVGRDGDGNTLTRLTDGSAREQAECYYESRDAYRPEVTFERDNVEWWKSVALARPCCHTRTNASPSTTPRAEG